MPERRHLLGLEQLGLDVARLVVEPAPLTDVADDGLDMEAGRASSRSAVAVTSTQATESSRRRRRSR